MSPVIMRWASVLSHFEPATVGEPAPAVAQGASGRFANVGRPLPSFPRRRESTRAEAAGEAPYKRAAVCLGALLLGLAASHPSAAQNNVPGQPDVIPFWVPDSGFDGFHTYFLVKWEEPDNKPSEYMISASDQMFDYPYTGNEGRFLRNNVIRSGSNRVYAIRVCSKNYAHSCTSDYSESTSVACAPATVSASSITDDGATLTVANLPARWWYKGEQSGATCTAVANASRAGSTSATITGLDGGTSYTYKIHYRDDCTEDSDKAGHWDVKATFTTKPDKVTDVTATPGNGSLSVSWTAVTGATSYTIQWKKADQGWDATNRQTTSTTSSATLSSLTNNTEYTLRVMATGSGGDGAWSDTATGTPVPPPSAPAVPSVVWGNASATLTWTAPNDNGSPITDYDYRYRNHTDGGSWTEYEPNDTSTARTRSLTGLTNGKEYRFGVRAGNAGGDSDWSWPFVSAIVGAPALVASPTLTHVNQGGRIRVAWTAPSNNGSAITGYSVWHREGQGSWTEVTGVAGTASSHELDLSTDKTHTIGVEAHNARGGSNMSTTSFTGNVSSIDTSSAELTAETATATGMTLSINRGWAAPWYYKYISPDGGTCSATAVTKPSKAVTGLDSNTAYTFAAYIDSGCSSELARTSSYATLPPKPAKPTVAVNVGSGKVKLTSSVTGTASPTKWQYKKRKRPGDYDDDWTDISSTSTSLSYTVSGLTDGWAYKFKVRARNASGFGAVSDESDTATLKPITLSADTATATGMTLKIASYSLAWYYKHTTPDDGSCSSTAVPAGTSSKTLTNLTSNTAYTFAAYSDSGCSSELASASARATLPDKPAKPTPAVAGSGKVKITSSVGGGSAPLTKWQYKKKKDSGDYDDWTDISSTSKTLSYTVTGLTDDSAYQFKVRARNASGPGETSDESDATTPRAVTLSADTATAAGMTLSISRNWSTAWYYKYTAPDGGSCSSPAVTTPSKAVTGLDSNTTYTFKAYSDNGCETELASASSWATLPPKPAKPTVAVNVGSGKVKLTSSVGGGSAALTKWQYRKKKRDDSYDDDWTDISSTSKTLSYTVTGLTDESSYQFRVRARNASGFGAESDESAAATPGAVTLSADTATATGMTLRIGKYSLAWYWKYTTPDGGDCSDTAVPAGTSSKAVTGLDSNTAYTFKAYSDSGCSSLLASASAWATLPPKAAKPTLTVNVGDGKVTLASSVGGGSAALTKWQYKKKKDSGDYDGDWTDISSTSKTLSYTVTGLTDDSAYQFKVRARNASGPGETSDESDAATPRAVTLSADTATATGMTLTIANWSAKWYYKHTTPDDGSCSTQAVPAGTSSKAVTGLDSNTAYTFAAYSDSGCSSELASASSWATLPPKPATPTLTVNVGDGKVTLTSSVGGGSAALTKWQYKKKKDSGDYDADWTDISSTSKTLSHTVTGLIDGSAYTFKVRARNASGFGAVSDESGDATPQAVALSADTATADGMTLTIGSYSLAWYWKYTTPDDGRCSTQAVPAGTSSRAVTGLDSNTAYTFAAYSDSGCSSELASGSPYATLPPKPATPTLTVDLGDGKVKLASSVTGTAALTKWQYKKSKDGGSYDADWTDVSSTSKTLSHVVTGLTDGSTYRFKVRARNASGFGAVSDESDAATPRAVTFSAGSATADGMTLTLANWSAEWYYLRAATSIGTCTSSGGTSKNTLTLTTLTANTAYTFKAYSDSDCSAELASTASYATLPPKPAKPALTVDLGDGKVKLASSVTGTETLEKWQYKKKKDSGDYDADWTDISSTSKTLSHVVTGLDRRLGVQVQGACAQRLGLRRGVGRVRRRDAAGGDALGGHGHGGPA